MGFKIKIGGFNLSVGSLNPVDMLKNQQLNIMFNPFGVMSATWKAIKHWLVADMRKDREQMLMDANTPRRIIYGTCRVSGQVAYVETSGDKHQYLHMIVLLAGHEVQGFGDIYLDDKLISTYGANAEYVLYDGTQSAACAEMVAVSAVNNETVTITATGNTVSGTARIGALSNVNGLFAGMTVTGTGLQAGTTITYVGDTYVDINKTATATGSTVSFTFSGSPQRWTANHKLLGCAYIYLKLTYSETSFAGGIPKVAVVVKGKKIYDPRNSTTGYSNNPALCIRDYMLMDESIGGMGCSASEIDDVSIIAAASICDEQVIKSTDGTLTEERYHCNGTISLDSTPKQIIDALLQSMAGEAIYSNAVWRIFAGAYVAPVVTIDESWLNGDIQFSAGTGKSERVNTVKGTFIDPTDSWALKAFPVMTSAGYVTADGGEELAVDLALSFTTSPTMCQRIAKIVLEQTRVGQTVSFSCNLKAFKLAVGDAVYINNSVLGWSSRIFRVKSWEFSIDGGIKLTLKQDDPAVYSWTAGEVSPLALPPPTIFPDPSKTAPHTGLTITETQYATTVKSIIKTRILLEWVYATAISKTIIQLNRVDYAEVGNSATSFSFDDISPGNYVFGIIAANIFGVRSAPLEINYSVLGNQYPPPDVDVFLVTPQQDGTRQFNWVLNNPPPDIAGYRIRFQAGAIANWDTMPGLHSSLLISSPFEINQLPAGDYVFAIKAEDTTGNQSKNAVYIQTTLPDPRLSNVWLMTSGTIDNWSGVKTGCFVNANGWLEANDLTVWDSLPPTWDVWSQWNTSPVTNFIYETPVMDIGLLLWFTPQIEAYGTGSITYQMTSSVDGVTWSEWGVIERIQSRYIKFKIMVNADAPTLCTLQELLIYIVIKPKIEEINDLDTASLSGMHRLGVGHIRAPLINSYDTIKQVSVTLQNVGAGWTWELIDKNTADGPEIKIYNSSHVLADATIDIYIKGV